MLKERWLNLDKTLKIGPLSAPSLSFHHGKHRAASPPLMMKTRTHQHRAGCAALSRNSGQDSRRPEFKLLLKSGRMWNWVGELELKATMGGGKKCARKWKHLPVAPDTTGSRRRSESQLQSDIRCVFIHSDLPLCETNAGRGQWRLYDFPKATCGQVQGLCSQRSDKAPAEFAKQEKCEAESKAQQVGRTGKVVFGVAALMSSKSHLKGPVWLDSCKSVQLLHFKMEKNYHQYLYGRLDFSTAVLCVKDVSSGAASTNKTWDVIIDCKIVPHH